MIHMKLDRVSLAQTSVTQIIHRNVALECFFHLPKCLLILIVFSYIYISQGSVEMHLQCGEMYNNHINAHCLQSVSVKEFQKSSIIGKDMDKNKVPQILLAHGV